MQSVSAAEANRSFSKLLGRVDKGEEILITSRGRPVAKLVPAMDEQARLKREAAAKELFADLRSCPVLDLPRVTRDEIYDYLDE